MPALELGKKHISPAPEDCSEVGLAAASALRVWDGRTWVTWLFCGMVRTGDNLALGEREVFQQNFVVPPPTPENSTDSYFA